MNTHADKPTAGAHTVEHGGMANHSNRSLSLKALKLIGTEHTLCGLCRIGRLCISVAAGRLAARWFGHDRGMGGSVYLSGLRINDVRAAFHKKEQR